jgi:phosphoesterase RecJ-like protein
MGSTLGLYHFLLKQSWTYRDCSNEFPDFLAWAQRPLKYSKNKENCTEILEAVDLIFTLDFNALHRVGGAMEAVLKWKRLYHDWPSSKTGWLCSIHVFRHLFWVHLRNVIQFHLFLDKKKTSTRQLEPAFIQGLTDSGSFRFQELETRIEFAELIDLGVENTKIPLYFWK